MEIPRLPEALWHYLSLCLESADRAARRQDATTPHTLNESHTTESYAQRVLPRAVHEQGV
jgi:hypothetical protein